MNFQTDEDLEKFIQKKKFFKSLDNYCLGETLKDCGEILAKIIDEAKSKDKEEEKP